MKPTGIYVLQTTDGCRVSALESYEDLFDGYSPDIVRYVNKQKIKESFRGAVMDYSTAMEIAKILAQRYPECDDGIFVMKDYQFYSYEDLVNGKASKN